MELYLVLIFIPSLTTTEEKACTLSLKSLQAGPRLGLSGSQGLNPGLQVTCTITAASQAAHWQEDGSRGRAETWPHSDMRCHVDVLTAGSDAQPLCLLSPGLLLGQQSDFNPTDVFAPYFYLEELWSFSSYTIWISKLLIIFQVSCPGLASWMCNLYNCTRSHTWKNIVPSLKFHWRCLEILDNFVNKKPCIFIFIFCTRQ